MKKSKRKDALYYTFEKGTEAPIIHVDKLPEGTWLPVSISAALVGYSSQMIRYLMKNGVIKAIQFPVGPILINHEEVLNNWVNYPSEN